ncbi:hypothetical protein E4U42_005796 [Claviceps africana]|uniref:GAT domain-containing protein n=1 Tax=Claviceps africana TaxID=83212 RepID=A0A8K0J376_9HYPO|nr:hypothetical protein E4U42_005796 [Claviceps africana]
MKAMKGLSMNKVLGSIRRKAGEDIATSRSPIEALRTHRNNGHGLINRIGSSSTPLASAMNPADNPEITAHNSVKAFCESGGNSKSDEVLFLPPIVDAAESSPAAAAECARVIRKFLSKDYSSKPSWQYNAIMLVRILSDNPGETFTRNLDEKFVDTIRALLKNVKDRSVWQILMETLDDFEATKVVHDQNLAPLVLMWKKEKETALNKHGAPRLPFPPVPPRPNMHIMMGPPQLNRHSQSYFAKSHTNNRLPDAVELASRLEEARTSANLLEQVVMNTPASEMLQNELIKEFADRCLSASRSLQGYMVSENPAPDNDTMESLIDTNEQLQTALNQHQRAVLKARKQLGLGNGHQEEDSPAMASDHSDDGRQGLIGAARAEAMAGAMCTGALDGGKGKHTELYKPAGSSNFVAGSGSRRSSKEEGTEDPFADPSPADASKTATNSGSTFQHGRYAHEPFHPGSDGPHASQDARLSNGHGSPSVYNGPGKLQTPHGSRRTALGHGGGGGDDDDDDDIYEASPKGKGPLEKE